jgi:hypothetical protein
MDTSQLWYPEIVHSGPKRKFSSYYMPKFSDVLRNTPKQNFGPDGVEWMRRNFGAPNSAFRPEREIFIFLRVED